MTTARLIGLCWLLTAASSATAIPASDMVSFVDGFVEARMAEHEVVGVTVSVVHEGRVLFAKGYGYADLDQGRQVDAERTLFRPGSISKTLTWTAAMQLYERGQLDLEADIQSYLPNLAVPNAFGRPITMLDLMGHRPGLEEHLLGHLFLEKPADVPAMASYLADIQPRQVREPGALPSYSNYGSGLAGLVVQEISGQPFNVYVEQNITGPLGMSRTTFREPGMDGDQAMGAELANDVSKGYIHVGPNLEHSDFVYISHNAPAGGLSTTATDMATWMLTHLGGGELNGVRVLATDTAARMHTQHASAHPELPGLAHGFIQSDVHGYRSFGHSGGMIHFLSNMIMIPDLQLGIFISTNTTERGSQLIDGFPRELVERYFPPGPRTLPALASPADLTRYEGDWVFTRRNHSTVEKLNLPTLAVTSDGEALIFGQPPIRYQAVGDHVFQAVSNPDRKIAFSADEQGQIIALHTPGGIQAATRAGWLDRPQLVFGLLGFAALTFFCVLVGAWLRRREPTPAGGGGRAAARVLYATSGVWIAGICALIAAFVWILGDFRRVFFDYPPGTMTLAAVLALLASVLTLVSLVQLRACWQQEGWSLWRRTRHTLVVALACVVAGLMFHFNVLTVFL